LGNGKMCQNARLVVVTGNHRLYAERIVPRPTDVHLVGLTGREFHADAQVPSWHHAGRVRDRRHVS